MAYVKADAWVLQQIAATGLPLVGGSVTAYITGTTTELEMYTNSAGTGGATSFTLNSLGMPQSAGGTAVDIYLDDAYVYKFIIRDSLGVAVGPAIDPVYPSGGNGLTGTMTSMEALRASSISFDYVETVAFYEDGTTGSAKLYRDGTGTPTGSGAAVIAAALAAGTFCNAAGHCYKLRRDQDIWVYMFGVKWDDSTDDTACLQSAVAWANAASQASGRIVLKCPKGGCRITSLSFASMTGGIIFEGEDRISSFIRYNNATGNVFNFTGARFVTFRKLQLLPLSSALKTAGHLFHIDNGDDLLFEELRLNSSYEAFYITDTTAASSNIRIRDVEAVDYQTAPWNWLIRIHGACSSIKLDNVLLQTSATLTGGGVLVEKNGAAQCDTLRMFRVDVQKFSSGLVPAGIQIEGGDFIDIINSNLEVGGTSGRGIKVTGGSNVHLLNNHVTTALIGLEVTDVDGLQVIGGRYYFCQNEGIKVSGGEDITINAVDVFDNGQAAAGTYDGIDAANAAVKDIKITDCQIGSVRGSIVTLNNGIDVTGAVGAVVVTDNIIDDACIAGKAVKFSLSGAALPENCLVISDNGFGPVDIVATHARVRTTDGSATTLWSYTLNDNEHLNIVANVLCQGSSGTNTGGYIRAATVYRDGGSAVIEGSVTAIHSAEYNAGLDATITVSGNDVRVTVTGIAATTFDWHANVQINGKTSAA